MFSVLKSVCGWYRRVAVCLDKDFVKLDVFNGGVTGMRMIN